MLIAGKTVLVVNGAYRGSEATLMVLDEKHFCCSIQLSQVSCSGLFTPSLLSSLD